MYRAICGTYVNSSPAGGPSSHPTPGRGEGVPCTPQANAPVPTATSAGSYSVATSRVGRKFTGPGRAFGGAGDRRGAPGDGHGEPSTVTGKAGHGDLGAGHSDPGSSVGRWDRNGPEGSRPGSPWTQEPVVIRRALGHDWPKCRGRPRHG